MSSSHGSAMGPLEPSNLLEPLDLERQWDPPDWKPQDTTGPAGGRQGMQAESTRLRDSQRFSSSAPPSSKRSGRGPLKVMLALAGAAACFAAGAAASKFAVLPPIDSKPEQPVSAARSAAPAPVAPTRPVQSTDSSATQTKPNAETKAKPADLPAAEAPTNAAANSGAPSTASQSPTGTAAPPAPSKPATQWVNPPPKDAPVTEGRTGDSVRDAGPVRAQEADSDKGTSEKSSPREQRSEDAKSHGGDGERADRISSRRREETRASARQERQDKRARSSRQSRHAVQGDGENRERSGDEAVRGGSFWQWGRERGDDYRDYPRDDGRRAFGRASREETFGRSYREHERGSSRSERERDRGINGPRGDSGLFGLFPRFGGW
jgi:hypothetical protein